MVILSQEIKTWYGIQTGNLGNQLTGFVLHFVVRCKETRKKQLSRSLRVGFSHPTVRPASRNLEKEFRILTSRG